MKIFHLSDLHLGLKLMNRDLREDQEYILHEIVEISVREQADVMVIAGDIYDKAVASAEAVELFDHFITELTEQMPHLVLMMISGNHDSAPRVNCFRNVLSKHQLYMIGMPPQRPEDHIEKVCLEDAYGPVNFYLLPFVKPSMVKMVVDSDENGNNLSYDETVRRLIQREDINPVERNILVSHQFYVPKGVEADKIERMESELRTVGNIDEVSADILETFDYAALGHIHKPMKVGCECFRYSGTPLACSVSEAGQEKGILMVELKEKGQEPKISKLPLRPLRQIKILKGSLEELLTMTCEDYVTVVLTDKIDLNVVDMQEQLRMAFPHLLEIRRELNRTVDYSKKAGDYEQLDPFELCCSFLKDLDEEEKDLLKDVLNSIQGGV